MTIEDVQALIPGGKFYRLTTDARYIVVIKEGEWDIASLESAQEAFSKVGIKAVMAIVSDPAAIRVFKLERPKPVDGELRPVEARREKLSHEDIRAGQAVPALRAKDHRID